MRRTLVTAIAALALFSAPTEPAFADGDPASDVLLNGDVFFPYQPLVSLPFTNALNAAVTHAHSAGFPIKVAMIASASDLGAVAEMFGKPQQYSDFLDREISYNKQATLLVVMPQGLGATAAGSAAALARIKVVASTNSSDGLARAAIQAVSTLSAQAGHPIPATKIPTAGSGGGNGGGSSPLLTFGAPVLLVLLAALGAHFVRSRQAEDRA